MYLSEMGSEILRSCIHRAFIAWLNQWLGTAAARPCPCTSTGRILSPRHLRTSSLSLRATRIWFGSATKHTSRQSSISSSAKGNVRSAPIITCTRASERCRYALHQVSTSRRRAFHRSWTSLRWGTPSYSENRRAAVSTGARPMAGKTPPIQSSAVLVSAEPMAAGSARAWAFPGAMALRATRAKAAHLWRHGSGS